MITATTHDDTFRIVELTNSPIFNLSLVNIINGTMAKLN